MQCECAKVLKDTKTDNYFVVVSCLHKPRFNLWLNQNLFSICLKAINRARVRRPNFAMGRFRCARRVVAFYFNPMLFCTLLPSTRPPYTEHAVHTTIFSSSGFNFLFDFHNHSDFICLGNEFNANAVPWNNCTSTIRPMLLLTALILHKHFPKTQHHDANCVFILIIRNVNQQKDNR